MKLRRGGASTSTDTDGDRQMLADSRQYPDRVWAVEGCAGIGRHSPAPGRRVLHVMVYKQMIRDAQRARTRHRQAENKPAATP